MPIKYESAKNHSKRKRNDPPTKICPLCKKTFEVNWHSNARGSGNWMYGQKFCSKSCSNKSRIRGGIDRHGYMVLPRTQGYPQMYEHRIEMERILGRELFAHETVHHKNGDRKDNRPKNLELWSSRHGRGQRVSDHIEFAKETLRLYPAEVSFIEVDMADIHRQFPHLLGNYSTQGAP